MIANRPRPGTTSRKSPSRLAPRSFDWLDRPVTFPPGRGHLGAADGQSSTCSCVDRHYLDPFLHAMCQGGAVKVSRCQGVKANFHRAALEASRPVAPRIASCDQEGPVIAPRYLAAVIVSRAWVVSVDHEQKKFSGILRICVRCSRGPRLKIPDF
jgi:hypothetical protein